MTTPAYLSSLAVTYNTEGTKGNNTNPLKRAEHISEESITPIHGPEEQK